MNCVGMFCEDIREEIGGTHTIIGVMPAHINLQGHGEKPSEGSLLFPKLAFYIRVNFEASGAVPRQVSAEASIPGRETIKLGELSIEAIESAFRDSLMNDLPEVGVIFKGVVSPLPITKSGVALLRVRVDGREENCGALDIRIIDQS